MVLGRRTTISVLGSTGAWASASSESLSIFSEIEASSSSIVSPALAFSGTTGVLEIGIVATLRGGAVVGVFLLALPLPALTTIAGRATFETSGGGIVAAADGAGSLSSLYAASSAAAGSSWSYSRWISSRSALVLGFRTGFSSLGFCPKG